MIRSQTSGTARRTNSSGNGVTEANPQPPLRADSNQNFGQNKIRNGGGAAWRYWFTYTILALFATSLVIKAVHLQLVNHEHLLAEGAKRQQRTLAMPSHRGMLLDRHGEPLAISVPIETVWANPSKKITTAQRNSLAAALEMPPQALEEKFAANANSQFLYLRREVNPAMAAAVTKLDIPSIHLRTDYRRYYPSGEISAHLIGYTGIDDHGQEGLELAYDDRLSGQPGKHLVRRSLRNHVIEVIEQTQQHRPGEDLYLSIDKRLQYIAYRELQAAVLQHSAKSASAIAMDVHTGEVLAIVNQPSYNPNNFEQRSGAALRNRALVDELEPGSTLKPITLIAALELTELHPNSPIDTAPGSFYVGRHRVRDPRNYGVISLSDIIRKSSNVGASRIALALPSTHLWEVFDRFGFGRNSGSNFPGERDGKLKQAEQWARIDQAILAFGYGMTATPLQLVRAYSAIAADGFLPAVSFLHVDAPVGSRRVISLETARSMQRMLETVTDSGGTGTRAKVLGYRVAGKTGTSRKLKNGSYSDEFYFALFAGFAPASRPEVALVVVVDEPSEGEFYGGSVAAPVFSRIMENALRLRGVLPDVERVSANAAGERNHW